MRASSTSPLPDVTSRCAACDWSFASVSAWAAWSAGTASVVVVVVVGRCACVVSVCSASWSGRELVCAFSDVIAARSLAMSTVEKNVCRRSVPGSCWRWPGPGGAVWRSAVGPVGVRAVVVVALGAG